MSEQPNEPLTSSYYWARRVHSQICNGPRSVDALAEEFRAAMEAAVDEHIQMVDQRAYQGDASEGPSDSPEEAHETPHRISAQSIIVHFNDGSERVVHTHHPIIAQGGWIPRMINGVPFLILGHGVPRQMVPLHNVKSIDLSEEIL